MYEKMTNGDIISREDALNFDMSLEAESEQEMLGIVRGMQIYADYIKNLPGVGWISVAERLPEEEVDVLICNKDGNIGISRGSYSTEAKDCWIWYTSGWRFGKVEAWMPLPEPLKEETE